MSLSLPAFQRACNALQVINTMSLEFVKSRKLQFTIAALALQITAVQCRLDALSSQIRYSSRQYFPQPYRLIGLLCRDSAAFHYWWASTAVRRSRTWHQTVTHPSSWTRHSRYWKWQLCEGRSTIAVSVFCKPVSAIINCLTTTFYARPESNTSRNWRLLAHHMPEEMHLGDEQCFKMHGVGWYWTIKTMSRLTSSAAQSMSNDSLRRVWTVPVFFVIELGWVSDQFSLQPFIRRCPMRRLAVWHSIKSGKKKDKADQISKPAFLLKVLCWVLILTPHSTLSVFDMWIGDRISENRWMWRL